MLGSLVTLLQINFPFTLACPQSTSRDFKSASHFTSAGQTVAKTRKKEKKEHAREKAPHVDPGTNYP